MFEVGRKIKIVASTKQTPNVGKIGKIIDIDGGSNVFPISVKFSNGDTGVFDKLEVELIGKDNPNSRIILED